MKVIYISSACFKENKSEIDKTAKKKLQNSIIKFHNSIINGLKNNEEVENIYSLIGLPISIKTNRKIIWEKKYETHNEIEYYQVPFINLPIIKQLNISRQINKELKKIIKENNQNDICVIYDASFASIIPSISKTIIKNNIKSIGIFADIYDYMYDVKEKTNIASVIKKIFRKKLQNAYLNTSGYVFLTEQMNELINVNKKPYIIMEGIFDDSIPEISSDKYSKTLMYAGGLHKNYGVKKLIEAVLKCNIEDIVLKLYGTGDLDDYIDSVDSKRIKKYGLVDNNIVLQEETKVSLLVNPRPSDEEFTKYSFPSKIIEYMASGTPVLTTKLPGMPEEYLNYLYIIEDESIDGIKNTIEKILNKGHELQKKGEEAKKFIIENKNSKKQSKRIIDLINNIERSR